jgi:hypothetical protein
MPNPYPSPKYPNDEARIKNPSEDKFGLGTVLYDFGPSEVRALPVRPLLMALFSLLSSFFFFFFFFLIHLLFFLFKALHYAF